MMGVFVCRIQISVEPINWYKLDHGPPFCKILPQDPPSNKNFAFKWFLQKVYETLDQIVNVLLIL